MNGIAMRSGKALYLTPPVRQSVGSVWFAGKQPVADGFETTFRFRLTAQGGIGRADGFAFVLQNTGPAALAGKGSAGGFAMGDGIRDASSPGIPRSLAVFFDTFENRDAGDPSDNYIAICTNAGLQNMRWPPSRITYTRRLKTILKDGQTHTARVAYRFPALSVYLDDLSVPALTSVVDLAIAADSDGSAYIGFTASTGDGWQLHQILSWSYSAGQNPEGSTNIATVTADITFLGSVCLPDRTFCTPERAIVSERAPGQYHVVLPANLKWGAGIPNASGQPVILKNVRGSVCWDVQPANVGGCNGPAGSETIAGEDFLAPGRHAGSLIAATQGGETRFSINGRSNSFAGHEGFFEFDVEFRP